MKNIDLTIPRNKMTVFTGLSGSGKSTLAFDTIFAEGQRRYLESLSSYARQFLGQMEKPDVDYIEGLSPAISIDQKSSSHNPRSTVGTVTEIHDYLRLLYAKIGIPHCPICGQEIKKLSLDEIVERIFDFEKSGQVKILSPVVRDRKGEYSSLIEEMAGKGFSLAYVDGKEIDLTKKSEWSELNLARYKKHRIDILIDEPEIKTENFSRIFEATESALKLSEGIVKIVAGKKELTLNQKLACPIHETDFPEMEPRLFSFNNPYGACPECEGLGSKKEIDIDLVIPDKNKTITEGALLPWSYKRNNYQGTIISAVTKYYRIPENAPFRDLSDYHKNILINGEIPVPKIPVKIHSKSGNVWNFNLNWKGVSGFLKDRYFKTESEAVRTDIEKYMSDRPCPVCLGSRHRKEALLVTVGRKNIAEISSLDIEKALEFFDHLSLNATEKIIADRILKEIINRLGFLKNVGLGYLNLGRSANTLAGGETQRIRLASQIGSQLVGVLYVLDEPSIGLHARDNERLLQTLLDLRDLGNTLIVIEHDEETMRKSDFLVDIGPGAGKLGGEVVAAGLLEDFLKNPSSLTAKYLNQELKIEIPPARRKLKDKKLITIKHAEEHNLKNLTVSFPLNVFTCVTGVSGSGKSTLVEDILYKSASQKIMRSLEKPGKHKEIIGLENLKKVIMIDQSPIGRTPRSNPATYTGLFTPIRKIFSLTKEARAKAYSPGRFSFNVAGGRCENCRGEGFLKVEMQFMPDVYLPCDVCKEQRYNSETLKVHYKGKNIAEILAMTVSEAKNFFENFREIHEPLKVLEEVGLGYINLGQSATTLSGGEAQRIKLASELSRRGRGDTLYILDEPTTGLHFEDIKKLLAVLNRLVDAGNTVIVIEHNLDVVKTADYIVDLGPEGGAGGGKIVASGTPEDIARHSSSFTGQFLFETLNKK